MIFTVNEDQWGHYYFEIREGKLFSCQNDRKEQTYTEMELDIKNALHTYKDNTKQPFPELLAELRRLTNDRN